ncbi:2-phosphosulfolactate phosphatase [Flexivirga caeni]|uniref:Probable 2-phosphosulfolactate phosphatase n=2 Tax=Flexivirga caeni TaxID=2294115 RepID=A0A3M9MBK5_9MICO|nr:2-phosphosulfolactate phosphatase [Flexivirga caeni]
MFRRDRIGSCAVADLFGQGDFGIRLEWGPVGARATRADVAVVVDVLSFSTSVTVAVERGMRVFPYPWKGARAQEFATARGAILAVGRLESMTYDAASAPSLSPAGLLACEPIPRLVLPSPNGSTIAATLLEGDSTVSIGCLRNAQAVADWLAPAVGAGCSVAVIAAGERWRFDDSLRPALEDHLGAGAILSALVALGYGDRFSPEAWAAAELFDVNAGRLVERLHDCVGGRELDSLGFGTDVDVAAALNASAVVPVLVDGAFQPAGGCE